MTKLNLRRMLVSGCAAALVIALVWQANSYRESRAEESRRSQAVSTARDQVIDLTTLDSTSVSAKLKSLAARTSGDFRQQLQGVTDTFQELVEKNAIDADGSIDSTAVSSINDTDAVVLVASTALVTEGTKEPVRRTYRVRVKLERVADAWKINGMEFVQ